ncbi:MAG: DUF4252 domain-containing protein [Bacteroidales bacterium]|nr:DUF4252 domain-containing protein [Bacteroidales bacterium]
MKRLLFVIVAVLLMASAVSVEAAQKKAEESPLEKLMDSYKNVDGSVDLSIKRFWLGLLKMVADASDEPFIAEVMDILEYARMFVLSTEEGDEILSVKAGHEPRTPTETETGSGSSDDPENNASVELVGQFLSAADVILSEHYQLMTSESTEFGTIENVYYSDAFAELLFYETDADGSRLVNMILVKFDTKELKLPESEIQTGNTPMSEVLTSCESVSGVEYYEFKGVLLSVVRRCVTEVDDILSESEIDLLDVIKSFKCFHAATPVGEELLMAEADSASSENKSSCVSDEDMERLLSEVETVLEGHYRRFGALVNGYSIVSEPYGSTFSFDEASSGMYYFVDKSLTPASIVEVIAVKFLKEQDKVEAFEVYQIYVEAGGYEIIDDEQLEKILDIISTL